LTRLAVIQLQIGELHGFGRPGRDYRRGVRCIPSPEIRLSFLRNENVAAIGDGAKTFDHAIRSANDTGAEFGIDAIEPRGQPDSTGNVIEFSDGKSLLGENEIGPEDQRKLVAKLFATSEFDERGRLAAIEVVRNPRRLLAADAAIIEFVAGPNEKGLAGGRAFAAAHTAPR
jgi:hypothetical protein